MRCSFSFNQFKRQFDYALSLSYMRMLVYFCLVFLGLLLIVMLTLWGASIVSEKFDIGEVNIPGTAFMLLTDPGNISDVLPSNQSWIMGIIYAVIVTMGAVLFGGVLISLMSNSVQMRVDDFRNGNIYYNHKNHIVLIGYDPVVPALVKQLADHYKDNDIIVFTRKNSQEVREALATLVDVKNKHLVLYSGRRDSANDLSHLQVAQVKEVFIIGNRENDDHDALNFACLSQLVEQIKSSNTSNKPIINILLENQSTQTILQSTNLAQEWCKWARVIPFSFYENWTRQILSGGIVHIGKTKEKDSTQEKEYRYPHILINKESNEHVNIIIFGMSRLGITVGIEAAHALHFPKYPDGKVRKTKITFISKYAYEEMLLFRARYRQVFEIQTSKFVNLMGNETNGDKLLPEITAIPPTCFSGKDADFLDIDFEFIQGDAFSEQIHHLLRDRAKDTNCKLNVFTCTGRDSTDMNIGLLLPDEVLRSANVFIRQHHTGQLITWLHHINEAEKGKYANLYPFGMVNSEFDITHVSQEMGILINYFYNWKGTSETYQQNHLLTEKECQDALNVWNDETSIANQWSSSYCCYSFALKMAQWGINSIDKSNLKEIQNVLDNHIETLAYIEHNRWNMEKLLMGFRKPHQDEQFSIDECRKSISDKTKDENEKKKCLFRILKTEQMVHDYIRPFDELAEVRWKGKDEIKDDIRKIDYDMLKQIPWIINNRNQIKQYL